MDCELTYSVVIPMWVPFMAIVLVVTPIPIGVAHPVTATSIIMGRMIFRLTPAYVAVLVAGHTNAVVAIHIAAFIGMRDGVCWIKDRTSQACDNEEQRGFGSY